MLLWSRWLVVGLALMWTLPLPAEDSKNPPKKVPAEKVQRKEKKKATAKKKQAGERAKKKASGSKKPDAKKPDAKKPESAKPESTLPQPLEPPVGRSAETADQASIDADFAIQGEYMGRPGSVWEGAERVGLQIVALGDRKFQGLLLKGGLPGAGWDGATKFLLSGLRRNGAAAVVEDESWAVSVSGGAATVKRKNSDSFFHLEKWHRISPSQDASPPVGAIVLFDGTTTEAFKGGKLTEEGLLDVGALTKMVVGDFQLHLEFRTPFMPQARGQGRGNSGVYIQQRYEVQVLDSFGLEGLENECGSLYKQRRPDVNMCLPPMSWQTYDIYFAAARWTADGKKLTPARITVLHNGEPVHWNYEITGKTGGGKEEGSELQPILLQNHGNPVAYRNIWIVPGGPVSEQVVVSGGEY